MKASVQLPPYKSPLSSVSYDQWRSSASPLEVRTPGGRDTGVTTRVDHFSDTQHSQSQSSGTKTVTRTITPAGEMAVYASQSSVRFKMTSRSSKQQQMPARQTRERLDSDEGARDLYPVTTLRSHSLREASQSRTMSQCLPSPDFNIVHRDTERTLKVGDCMCGRVGV